MLDVGRFGKVVVLYGGDSAERAVSLNSGQAVYEALKNQGIEAHLLDSRDKIAVMRLQEQGFARAFIALHGRGGEDGQMQALLEWQGLPYTGSGVLACALAMDKVMTKRLWSGYGLPVAPECVLSEEMNYAMLCARLGAEVLAVKPALEGSSVGVSRVSSQQELLPAIDKAGGVSEKIMVEPWIVGRELTCVVLAGKALPVIEIRAAQEFEFYDFKAKYEADNTGYFCPAPLEEALALRVQELAVAAFTAVGGKGWGRVDFILDENNRPWLLEVNMVPGMTSHSLVPLAARAVGMSFEALVLALLEQTLDEDINRYG